MEPLLVTTALPETYAKHESEVVFLGEWCKLYSNKQLWQILKSRVLPFHWDDRVKLKNDHDYLKGFYEKLLPVLTDELNRIHNIKQSVSFWRIVIGPWLITYLPILFDRWEMLRIAFESESKYSYVDIKLTSADELIPKHLSAFLELLQTDLWNYEIYTRILKEYYSDRISFLNNGTPLECPAMGDSILSKKVKILSALDQVLQFFGGRKGILFYHSYFPPTKLFTISLSLFQVPRFYLKTFSHQYRQQANLKLRSQLKLTYKSENEFERFVISTLLRDIPRSYLEEFKNIQDTVSKINFRHHTILTANAYWADEPFKIWSAQQKSIGRRLLICQHGGSLPPLFDTFQHEEDISDQHLIWFRPYHTKHKQLPPNKISKRITAPNPGQFCAVIGFESPRFSYRATAGAISSESLEVLKQLTSFCDALDANVRKALKIRPYPNLGWQSKLRLSDLYGEHVVETNLSYKTFLKQAKVIVCTYPQTTFSESLASGKPTILIYEPKYNELIPETEELLLKLRKAKIVFTDPKEASSHLNSIWGNVDNWWNSAEVKEALDMFFSIALKLDGKWKESWVNYLKSLH